MSIGKDDPRLTAYALGEMDDADRAAFENELEHDPEARAEVEAIRTVSAVLQGDLAGEVTPGMTEAQRASVAQAASRPRRARAIPWWTVPLAAAVVVGFGLLMRTSQPRPAAELAQGESAEHKALDESRAEGNSRGLGQRPDGQAGDDGWSYAYDSVNSTPISGTTGTGGGGGSHATQGTPTRELFEERGIIATGGAAGGGGTASDGGAGDAPLDIGLSEPEPSPAADPRLHGPQGGNKVLRLEKSPMTPSGIPVAPGTAAPAGPAPGARSQSDPEPPPPPTPSPGTESYDRIADNAFRLVAEADTSTFSIDVDTASYANVRRFLLSENRLPPPDAVRIEEMVNYFDYDYAPPTAGPHPFAARVETATCPWNSKHRLARIAIKGRVFDMTRRPPTNLVFLLDVSGSMRPADKLPLVRQAMHLLVDQLDEGDTVSIVVYAGAAGLVLPPTAGDDKAKIRAALDRLEAGGSTNGGQGIQLAYDLAVKHFIKSGVNRVILATDGDFNVGISDRGSLTRLIEEKAKTGVFLSVLGVGTGNLKDATMEELSNKGNGNYAYLDSLKEARKVLVQQAAATLVTIAKDVKIQVFFNPRTVAAYRLIGYENRLLAKEDFNDDTKDAGEIGAGHSVTALYEIVPAGTDVPGPKVDPNPFVQKPVTPAETPVADPEALFRLRLRYKAPEGDASTLMEEDIRDSRHAFAEATADFQWAASVASFGMVLRGSPHRGEMALGAVLEIARAAVGSDEEGYRAEFVKMVEAAQRLAGR